MLCYHGTTMCGLNVLLPFESPFSILKKPLVYLSSSEALSSIYIWNRPYKWMTFEVRQDGVPVYNESFPGALLEFYGGVSGCIYACEGEFADGRESGIPHTYLSERPVPVAGCEHVPDAYEKILSYEREGRLAVNRFEALSDKRKEADERMILGAIRRLNLLAGKHPLSGFVMEKFPQLWEKASGMGEKRNFTL